MADQQRLMFGTGVSSEKEHEPLLRLVSTAVENGITAFDTAPSYRSEAVLGAVIRDVIRAGSVSREGLLIQDKVDAWQMAEGNGEAEPYVVDALKKMQLAWFDTCLIHWPVPEYTEKTLESLLRLKEKGLIRSVGVCNVRMRQLRALEKAGLLPDVVQIERNPLRTCEEETAFCLARGIRLQSYSPLCKFREEIRESELLKALAEKYGRSIGQVVLRWHLDTGASPIFTTKKAERIREYAALSDFSLTEAEIGQINGMNRNFKMYLESMACPGF